MTPQELKAARKARKAQKKAARRGPPKHIGQTHQFNVTIPLDHYEYLTLIARLNRLGPSESLVAAHILIRELDAMMNAKYHEQTFPKG